MMGPMEWLAYVVASLFTLLGLGCLFLVALSLPGTWILLILALVIELVDVYYLAPPHETFGWGLLAACLLLALLGELLEFGAGVAGAKAGGGTRRGMVGALVGGLLGAIVLTPLLPIPVVGTLVGALLGTFAGALLAERTHPERGSRASGPEAPGAPSPGTPPGTTAAPTPPAAADAPSAEVGRPAPGGAGWGPDLRAASGATVGRLLGTLGKLAMGIAVWLALSVAAFWP